MTAHFMGFSPLACEFNEFDKKNKTPIITQQNKEQSLKRFILHMAIF
jgi:hypothetical protein